MAQPVVLAFQQMMQGKDLRGAIRSRAVGLQPARDNSSAPRDRFQLRLEGGRFLAIGMAQSPVARGKLKHAFSGSAVFRPGFSQDRAQDLAVGFGGDRQPMLE